MIVRACCVRAEHAGVRVGMPVAEAGGLLRADAVRLPHAPERDAAALEALAHWCSRRFSPTVAPDPPDGLLLDVTGCAPLHAGEERLIASALDGLGRLHVQARAAIAPTYGAAWALARHADRCTIIPPDASLAGVLSGLPIELLRLAARTAEDLRGLGIETLGHLIAMPRSTLPSRFGPEPLLNLDRALGQAIEAIAPVRPSAPPRAERAFDGPTTRWEALEITLRELLGTLCVQLQALESGARLVTIELDRSDLPPTAFTLSLSHPSRDARHLWSIARPHLERAHLGFGVEGVRVTANRVSPLPHEQGQRWWDGAPGVHRLDERAVARLADTLANRLGHDRVCVVELVESRVPERAQRYRPIGHAGEGVPTRRAAPGDRPTTLLDPPEPVRAIALTPDGPVMRVQWRGEDLAIVACLGPERIGPEWWRGDRSGRDYFRAQDHTGRWLWIAREIEPNRWSVHGVWG